MKKTMVYLDDDQYLSLKRTAVSSQKKMSEIIREALAHYLRGKRKRPDYFSFVGAAAGPKRGRTSEHAEDVLREVLKSSL